MKHPSDWLLSLVLVFCVTPALAQQQAPGSKPATPVAATPTAPAPAPAANTASGDYVGSDTCFTCHDQEHKGFLQTRMGKVFFNPRATPWSARAASPAAERGRAHVEAGGDKEAIIRFGKDSGKAKLFLTKCSSRGQAIYWNAGYMEIA